MMRRKTIRKMRRGKKNYNKFSKTRKIHGGNGTGLVGKREVCGLKESREDCLKRFIDDNKFFLLKVPGDGNCFFASIGEYLRNKDSRYPEDIHKRLRQAVYEHFRSQQGRNQYEPFVENYNKEVEKLRQDKHWSSDINDIVINAVADLYNMELHIHNFDTSSKPYKFIEYVIEPSGYNNSVKKMRLIVHLLRRGDNHFDLLFDEEDTETYLYRNLNGPVNLSNLRI
jgi:hypothetical protein